MGERILQSSFSAGEFAKIARDRADLQAYFQGADLLDNLWPLVEGAARRRPGTRFVAEVKDSAVKTALIAFTRASEDAVLIEAGNLYFRYYDGDSMARLMNGGAIVETATPYGSAMVSQLYWSQSADVLFLTVLDATVRPYALRRFADTNWSLVPYEIKFGPFLPRSDVGPGIEPSAATGNITLVAGSALFTAAHVGARLRLWEIALGVPYEKWLPEKPVTIGALREFAGNVYASLNNDTTSNQPPVHDAGQVSDRAPGGAIVIWEYRHDLSGSVKITGYTSPTLVTATVEERVPHALPEPTPATANWAFSAFSDVQGWPRLVGVYEQRLFFISTLGQPDTIFLSRTDGYNATEVDFKQSKGNDVVEDDHAIVRTLADNEVNVPAWAISDEQLLLGTARGLMRVGGPSLDEPITPAGATARRIPGTKPAGKGVKPVIADDAVLYVSTAGRRLYEYLAGNPVRTLNIRASHIGGSPIKQLAWAGEPFARLFALDAAGRLFVMVYERAEGVVAWARLTPGGSFAGGPAVVEHIERVKDKSGLDRLALIVKRTIGGATRRWIERLDLDFEGERLLADQANFMDAATPFDFWNAAATSVTVTAAPGSARGAAVTLAASAGTPFTGKAAAEFHVRKVSVPARADDAVGVLRMTIDTVTGGGAGATATLLNDPDEAERLINQPLTQWGFASSSISGLDRFNGETVRVAADGIDYGDFLVAGGAIALPDKVMRGFAGLETRFAGRSLPLLRQIEGGTSRGKKLAIMRGAVSLFETGDEAAQVRVIEDGVARDSAIAEGRRPDDIVGVGSPLRTGVALLDLSTSAADEVQIEVHGGGALPLTIRSISIEYENET